MVDSVYAGIRDFTAMEFLYDRHNGTFNKEINFLKIYFILEIVRESFSIRDAADAK